MLIKLFRRPMNSKLLASASHSHSLGKTETDSRENTLAQPQSMQSVPVLLHEILVVITHPLTHGLNLVFSRQYSSSEMVSSLRLSKTAAWHNDNACILQHLLAVQPLAWLVQLLGLLERSIWQRNGGESIQCTIN